MEDRQYRKYAEDFKLEALELLKRGGKSAGEIERELGITPGLLVKMAGTLPDHPKGRTGSSFRSQ